MRIKNIQDIKSDFNVQNDLIQSPESGFLQIERLGIQKDVILLFSNRIFYSKSRRIPVFLYGGFFGGVNVASYFSCSFRQNYILRNEPSFFFNSPTLSPNLITGIVVCPTPIELMSYVQLKKPNLERTVMLCAHPEMPLKNIRQALDFFPNAKFTSIFSKASPYERLKHLSIDMSLQNIPHKIEISSGNVVFHIRKSKISSSLENINGLYLNKVRRHAKSIVKHMPPPRPFNSYNSILNGTI